jgi:hypothetical protein
MNVTRAAALAAVLGGLVWVAAAVIDWGSDVNPVVYGVGLVWFLLALAGVGYHLVDRAPMWLRAVVCVATPLLGFGVWFTITELFTPDYLVVLVGGLALLSGGAATLARTRPEVAAAPVRGRRAAR